MTLNITGNLYTFPLDFNLGFGICEIIDFTKHSTFDGLVLVIYDYKINDIKIDEFLDGVDNLPILFGPIPINKVPNIKGIGAWKLIGKNKSQKHSVPIFKFTNSLFSLYKTENWNEIKTWYKIFNFNDLSEELSYKDVSNLELKVLYSMKNIQIRTTMHFLLKAKEKIKTFYDLSNHNFNSIYLETVNLNRRSEPTHPSLDVIK